MPYKEESDLLWHSTDLRCEGLFMRQAYIALKSGDWEIFLGIFLGIGKLNVWTSAKVREFHTVVEENGADSIAQDVWRKSTDFLRRIIVAIEGQRGHCVACVPTSVRLKTTSGGSHLRTSKSSATGGIWSVQRKESEHNLGHTRQHAPPRSKSVSSAPCTARGCDKLIMRSSLWQTSTEIVTAQ